MTRKADVSLVTVRRRRADASTQYSALDVRGDPWLGCRLLVWKQLLNLARVDRRGEQMSLR